MSAQGTVVGIDVSKDWLDVALGGESLRVPNETEGVASLIERLRKLEVALVVMEATGGYETQAASALAGAGLRLAVVNPRQVRDFAKATGRLAKSDRIDAHVIAAFGQAIEPQIVRLPDEQARELQALVLRRSQLVGMRVQESNRLALMQGAMRKQIKSHIAWLDRAIDELNTDLTARLRQSPAWREKDELLRSFKGVGPITWERSIGVPSPPWSEWLPLTATAAPSAAGAPSGVGAPTSGTSCSWPPSPRYAPTLSSKPSTSA
jgi:transposase